MPKRCVGVGFSSIEDTYQAGAEACREAINAGSIAEPSLVLAFATEGSDPNELYRGIRSAVCRRGAQNKIT